MRVERVEALGFGPLSGAVLDLPEGMTLVFGPNEAGKSSWHGALYAGVCGVRRSRGRPSASDQEFEARHRPWEGGPWQVRVVVALVDGRRVELTQDLGARSGTARDFSTGRDVTSEILREQVPDASRWLGLDRDAFRAVACVPQTALLQILDQPAQLADHLQRAAATAGTDATAAEAIRRISDFIADQVGTDRAWTKPLARAREDLKTAEDALHRAEQAHADTAQLREELREASLAKGAAELRAALVR
jgi:DNA repair protein SbcC/Rad50